MGLFDCRAQFQAGKLEKPNYIDEMYNLHSHLFEYADFISHTDIASIEILDHQLIMTLRGSGLKLWSASLDKRAAPFEILNFDAYEKTDAEMILDLLTPQMVFFDIGANIGWYSMNVAKQDASIQLHAFEPIPQTFAALKRNVALNQLQNITLYNMGFSDRNQEMTFYLDPQTSVSASARNLSGNAKAEKIVAKAEKLDDFFGRAGLTRLDFIKCDVEGAELFVYLGGLETLKRHQPIIFTEMLRKWSAKFDYHPNEIIQLLGRLGYCCFYAQDKRLVKLMAMDEDTKETNFFFLHQDKHADQIRRLSE